MRKAIYILFLFFCSCSNSDDIESPPILLPENPPVISQGVEVEILKQGQPLIVFMNVLDEWEDLSQYDFKTNIGGFFHPDSINKVISKEDDFYRFELPEGKYLLHIGSGPVFPGFFSLKEFTVTKGKVVTLKKDYSAIEMDFSKISEYQREKGVYIQW